MLSSFHSRMLLVFVGLVMLAEFGTTFAVMHAAERTAYGMAERQLTVADHLVQDALATRDEQYRHSLQALVADFGFREAVASRDAPTIGSALVNQGARVSADVVVLLDNTGQVLASTDSPLESAPPATLLATFGTARAQPPTPAVVLFKGKLMQVVVVPVRAPDTIAWLGMGFVVRDSVLEQIKTTSGVDISLMVDSVVTASTLTAAKRDSVAAQVKGLRAALPVAHSQRFDGEDVVALVQPVTATSGSALMLVLQLPKQTVIAPLLALRRDLLRWGGLVTIGCLLASIFSARVLTRPVNALANAARSLRVVKRNDASEQSSASELSSLTSAVHSLAHRTRYDALTELPNRALFAEWLSVSVARAEREKTPLAVVIIDLDGLRAINESMGHVMGDLVLRKVAQRLLRTMRPSDMVARLGNDEFVVALEGVGQTAAAKIVDRLAPIISKPMQSPQGVLRIGMRAGIAAFPEHARDLETLMRLADAAVHQSKTHRQRTVVAKALRIEDVQSNTSETINRMSSMHDMWGTEHWQGDDLATQPLKTIDESQLAHVPDEPRADGATRRSVNK